MSIVDTVFRAKTYRHNDVNHELKAIRKQLCVRFIEEEVSRWRVVHNVSNFDRRMTCIEWHKLYPHMVAFGSYSGDLYLLNTVDKEKNHFIKGIGYGYGAITDMTFSLDRPLCMYNSCLDGTFSMKDFEGRHGQVFLDTNSYKFWWTSVDLSPHKLLFVGGNSGKAVLLDTEGHTLYKYDRFHKGKIQCAKFCPASSNILATASNDKTVALWDIRTWGESNDSPKPFAILQHDAPINSAYFDPIYGSRILTTTQNSELRVYDAHNWDSPTVTMNHPHRNFQHITHIKATWHPFYEDLCVVGRYADADDPDKTRCVDLIDLNRGVVAAQFYDPNASQIMTVNKLNEFGDMLATGMGSCALVWSIKGLACNDNQDSQSVMTSANNITLPNGTPQQRRGKKRKGDHDDDLKKLKVTKITAKLKLKK